MLLGAARILKDMEEQLPGTVKLMFQPGEEMGYGSRTMVEDGLLEDPGVDAAMALHVGPQLEVGKLNYSPGVASGRHGDLYCQHPGQGRAFLRAAEDGGPCEYRHPGYAPH